MDTGPEIEVDQDANAVAQLSLSDIREELTSRNLDATGLKAELQNRLVQALKAERLSAEMRKANQPKQQTKLFVGQVPNGCSREELMRVFSEYGTVVDANLLSDKVTGTHKGCGFVTMGSQEEAEAAIAATDGKVTLPGAKRELIVNIAGANKKDGGLGGPGQPTKNGEFKLYVGMLSRRTTEQEVRDLFGQFGEVVEVHLMKNNDQTFKGSGFVKYKQKISADAAIAALHDRHTDKDAPGTLKVRYAQNKVDTPVAGAFGGGMAGFGMQGGFGRGGMGGGLVGLGGLPAMQGYGYAQPSAYGQLGGAGSGLDGYGMPAAFGVSSFGSAVAPPSAGPSAYGGFGLQPLQPVPTPIATARTEQQYGPGGANLFVYGIPDSYGDSDLTSLFSNFGNVISSKVQVDLTTGKSKGYGFVSYDQPKSAEMAIQTMDGFVIGQKRLSVRHKKSEAQGKGGQFSPY